MPERKPDPAAISDSARQLALLVALRDALVQTTLSLHDLKFELDREARKQAQRDCEAMLQRVRQQTQSDH